NVALRSLDMPGILRRHAAAHNGRVEEPAAPELERQNRPQMQIEIAPPLVQPQQPLDVADVEEPAVTATVRQQHVARKSGELAPEPACERYGEAVLRTIDDRIGENAAHRLLQEILGRRLAQAEPRRHLRRE